MSERERVRGREEGEGRSKGGRERVSEREGGGGREGRSEGGRE